MKCKLKYQQIYSVWLLNIKFNEFFCLHNQNLLQMWNLLFKKSVQLQKKLSIFSILFNNYTLNSLQQKNNKITSNCIGLEQSRVYRIFKKIQRVFKAASFFQQKDDCAYKFINYYLMQRKIFYQPQPRQSMSLRLLLQVSCCLNQKELQNQKKYGMERQFDLDNSRNVKIKKHLLNKKSFHQTQKHQIRKDSQKQISLRNVMMKKKNKFMKYENASRQVSTSQFIQSEQNIKSNINDFESRFQIKNKWLQNQTAFKKKKNIVFQHKRCQTQTQIPSSRYSVSTVNDARTMTVYKSNQNFKKYQNRFPQNDFDKKLILFGSSSQEKITQRTCNKTEHSLSPNSRIQLQNKKVFNFQMMEKIFQDQFNEHLLASSMKKGDESKFSKHKMSKTEQPKEEFPKHSLNNSKKQVQKSASVIQLRGNQNQQKNIIPLTPPPVQNYRHKNIPRQMLTSMRCSLQMMNIPSFESIQNSYASKINQSNQSIVLHNLQELGQFISFNKLKRCNSRQIDTQGHEIPKVNQNFSFGIAPQRSTKNLKSEN